MKIGQRDVQTTRIKWGKQAGKLTELFCRFKSIRRIGYRIKRVGIFDEGEQSVNIFFFIKRIVKPG